MRGGKCNMLSSLGCLLLCGSIALVLGNAQKLPKGKRPSLKVHINTTSDSILLKFLRPNPNVKLEGFLLGYGSNVSPNQYFPLPTEGKVTEAVVDAEPKYLIVVRPVPPPSQKKSCSGKSRTRKPLQLVVGTLTPSSVFLSWGFLINPHHDWTLPSHCPNDRFYTIRYREKDKEKKWVFQLCPATETIVNNLKPNTVYEFGVKDNVEGGIWSKIFNHKTIVGSKKINGKIQSTSDQVHTVPDYVPRKIIPVTIIKEVIQNITHRASIKSPDGTPIGGTILVHLIIPGLNETTIKLPTSMMFDISNAIKTQLGKNETLALPAESKTPEVEKIPAQPITVIPESAPRTAKPTLSSALEMSGTSMAPKGLPEFSQTKAPFPFEKVGSTLAPSVKTWMVSTAKTSDESKLQQSQTAPSETPMVPQKVEILTSPEMQATTSAPLQTTSTPSTPKRTRRPKPPRTKPERTTKPGRVTSKISKIPEPTQTTLAPSKTQFISLKPKIPLSPEVIHTTKPAPKQTPRTPSKQKASPWPRIPQTQTAPSDVLLPYQPDPDVPQSVPVLQPVTFTIEPPETTIAPLETRGSHFIPIISPSPSQEELQTALEVTDQSIQEHFTTKIPRTTELAKTTQAPHRLYTTPVRPGTPGKQYIRPGLNRTRPVRPRPSGIPKRNEMDIGVKQPPRPGGVERNASVGTTHSTKKTATSPGTRRPPMPPRPMPPQRKPLPPNNVNGKPGSAGISSSQATSPPFKATFRPTGVPLDRREKDKKGPTATASGDIGNITKFSSSPTRETDPLGKPIFTAPHVKYIQKEDDKPCSITESVSWFPTEEATEKNFTRPPQNPPTNLTVVTVEGCPSFVILDWEKPKNDTVTEYKVISTENGSFIGKNQSIQITNQTFSAVENLKPDTSYEFQVKPINPLGEGPPSNTVTFSTESADPRVSEPISAGRDAIWTERPFNSDSYSECKGKQYVKRTWYKKFVGVQLCNSLRYKIYLSDSLTGKFYNIGDQRGHGEDHCQFVDSFLDGRTGQQLTSDQLPTKEGYFRAVRQEPVQFGEIGGHTQINYVQWYECGTTIPGKW